LPKTQPSRQKRAARQHQAQTKQLNTVLLWMVKRPTTTPVDLEIVPLSPRGFQFIPFHSCLKRDFYSNRTDLTTGNGGPVEVHRLKNIASSVTSETHLRSDNVSRKLSASLAEDGSSIKLAHL
jgi:hypothetical protein